MRAADSLYLHFLDGTLDPRLWRGFDRSIADIAAYPGFQTGGLHESTGILMNYAHMIDNHVHAARLRLYDD